MPATWLSIIHQDPISHNLTLPEAVAYLRGGPCARPPPPCRTAMIFVTILGLFLAPFRDKIAATSDQMRFFGPENTLICVCGRSSAPDPAGELTELPSAANLFTVDSRRVVPAR